MLPRKSRFSTSQAGLAAGLLPLGKRFICFHSARHPVEMVKPESNACGTDYHASPVT